MPRVRHRRQESLALAAQLLLQQALPDGAPLVRSGGAAEHLGDGDEAFDGLLLHGPLHGGEPAHDVPQTHGGPEAPKDPDPRETQLTGGQLHSEVRGAGRHRAPATLDLLDFRDVLLAHQQRIDPRRDARKARAAAHNLRPALVPPGARHLILGLAARVASRSTVEPATPAHAALRSAFHTGRLHLAPLDLDDAALGLRAEPRGRRLLRDVGASGRLVRLGQHRIRPGDLPLFRREHLLRALGRRDLASGALGIQVADPGRARGRLLRLARDVALEQRLRKRVRDVTQKRAPLDEPLQQDPDVARAHVVYAAVLVEALLHAVQLVLVRHEFVNRLLGRDQELATENGRAGALAGRTRGRVSIPCGLGRRLLHADVLQRAEEELEEPSDQRLSKAVAQALGMLAAGFPARRPCGIGGTLGCSFARRDLQGHGLPQHVQLLAPPMQLDARHGQASFGAVGRRHGLSLLLDFEQLLLDAPQPRIRRDLPRFARSWTEQRVRDAQEDPQQRDPRALVHAVSLVPRVIAHHAQKTVAQDRVAPEQRLRQLVSLLGNVAAAERLRPLLRRDHRAALGEQQREVREDRALQPRQLVGAQHIGAAL
eukprot:scaffold2808_cov255-Pinguiococcus_pyrenoidosus.AAC.37